MFPRIIILSLAVQLVCGVEWCKVFQADHMRFTEIENKEQPYYDYLVSQNYNFSAVDQVYYKFAFHDEGVYYAAPLPLILSSTTPYTMAQLVPGWTLTNPLSRAFPSFEWNQNPPRGIYCATDVQIDNCGRLWIIDRGVKTEQSIVPEYPPKILVWSFKENRMILFYTLPAHLVGPGKSVFTHLVIDTRKGCDRTYAIASDSGQKALVIIRFNQRAQKLAAWRVLHDTFAPQPELTNFTYGGKSIFLNLGVYSITIVPAFRKGDFDYLYYSSFAGNTWYKVPLVILYDEDLWTKGYSEIELFPSIKKKRGYFQKVFKKGEDDGDYYDATTYVSVDRYFVKLGQVGYVTAARCAYDPIGYGFYCPAPDLHAITYWNVRKPMHFEVIFRDDVLLNYPVQIIIRKGRDGRQEIYVVCDSLIKLLVGAGDFNFRYNFYLLGCKLQTLFGRTNTDKCVADYCRGY